MTKSTLDVAIIGAGPYGLSLAAHFKRQGIGFRIFGRPMDSWTSNMPKGMLLKSDGFASNLSDPENEFTLRQFCEDRAVEYGDTGVPVKLDTFTGYGLAFAQRMVPSLENKLVVQVDRIPDGFALRLEDGEVLTARRVVMAVGITHFEHIPKTLAHLPSDFLSHSNRHQNLEPLKQRKVLIIGSGASALDLAGLLHQAGSDVHLACRSEKLIFHSKPTGKPRSTWQRIRHPQSGLGPGMRSRFFADAPWAFFYLPRRLRLEAVRRALGPSAGWFVKDMVVGRVPMMLGCTPQSAEIRDNKVHLELRGPNGSAKRFVADHVIAATGYKVDVGRLTFLSEDIRTGLRTIEAAPVLSSSFESSVPGLYFVGIAAANSFGPLMRFAFGARFAAQKLTRALEMSLKREGASAPSARFLTNTNSSSSGN